MSQWAPLEKLNSRRKEQLGTQREEEEEEEKKMQVESLIYQSQYQQQPLSTPTDET